MQTKQKLNIAFNFLLIGYGIYILITDYDPQKQGQSIILAMSLVVLVIAFVLSFMKGKKYGRR